METLTNIEVKAVQVDTPDPSTGLPTTVTYTYRGMNDAGVLRTWPVMVLQSEAPHDSDSWASFWDHDVVTDANALNYDPPHTPPFNPWG